MEATTYLELVGFGAHGWGFLLAKASLMTLFVAALGFLAGSALGALCAFIRLRDNSAARLLAVSYTTVFRGVPDLLVIYLFYFGGAPAVGKLVELVTTVSSPPPAIAVGVAAIGVVSGAYQAEVFRGAYASIGRGEIEAGLAIGFSRVKLFQLVVLPEVLRYALPGLGNVWQLALKESALISVIGVVELLRQTVIAAGSTRRPFDFYLTCAALFLLLSWLSSIFFRKAERRLHRNMRRA